MNGPKPIPRPQWSTLPREGCVGVEAKLSLAPLRFEPRATLDEHEAPFDVDVVCLDGAAFVSVGEKRLPLRAGESICWPRDVPHRLWTEDETMTTLMAERA